MRGPLPSRLRSVAGQAATETMLTMSFLMLLIFATVQLTWWSNFKYGANLGAFAAMRTAMVGGMPNEQLIAARQVVNVRRRQGPGEPVINEAPLQPMVRMVRGGATSSSVGGLLNGMLGNLNGLLNVFTRIPGLLPPTAPDLRPPVQLDMFGGLIGGLPGGVGQFLPSGLSSIIGNGLSGLLGSGPSPVMRTRYGLAYVINGAGGYPIQDGVRLVGWSHVTAQPPIGENGDNGGGFFGGFGGFAWSSGLPVPPLPPDVLQGISNLLNRPGATP